LADRPEVIAILLDPGFHLDDGPPIVEVQVEDYVLRAQALQDGE
jgi:hypothetical protein